MSGETAAAAAAAAKRWINGDESAQQMLGRALTSRPSFALPPPLHRAPLRAGNVVEIAGPSPSAKTQILVQAAVSCILPKERNGVHYGGLGHSVLYIDLDCRFDVSRLVEMLRHRIVQVNVFLGQGARLLLTMRKSLSCP